MFSTPKTMTEVGRCMVAFHMVALPLADNRKMFLPLNLVQLYFGR
jgi:hypothetical protein